MESIEGRDVVAGTATKRTGFASVAAARARCAETFDPERPQDARTVTADVLPGGWVSLRVVDAHGEIDPTPREVLWSATAGGEGR